MTESELSPVKRALLEIRELRARVAELEGAAQKAAQGVAGEPVAIVGCAIRAPGGVVDMASFERLLWGGVDAIGPIPRERWNLDDWYDADRDVPGKMTTREGGFVGEVDRFDAEFFGIAPLEAASMDPQQRLALELAWEALEDAGRPPLAQAGSRTGVYLGIASGDYGRTIYAEPERIDPYYATGNSYSVASGRIAYLLDLHGPALSIDTACSSSLVAVHLALRALRNGECDQALAGGVNLILSPELNINFSKAGMMAADGRCKTFDARADGYVRGEGGALVVLRRLSDALADGDRILAVLRGSAINQDGRSAGLTAPNGPAQEAVLREALADAGIPPAQVGYVEAHGTGTSLGDPIEVNALGAVFGQGRESDSPLALGSVKTNVGHLEAAAGIVGLAKVVLALQRREIPPQLHLTELNPHIEWAAMPLTVPTRATPFAGAGGRFVGGVSSFGFSGTNAHVVLEAAPTAAARDPGARKLALLAVSARDDAALAALVERYRTTLAGLPTAAAALSDLCFTANAGRSHQALRLAAQAADAATMQAELAAWQRGEAGPAVMTGRAAPTPLRVAFLFPGQGPQFLNMGCTLYEQSPVFREAFDRAAEALDGWLPQPLKGVVFAAPGSVTPLNETQFSQPAMFAMEVSLAALWTSWGITPVAVMGHSFGEYGAAHVAGALTLDAAARMVAARGRLPQALPRDGAMMVIEATEAEVADAISRHDGRLAVAAINGAANTVISGERYAVQAVADSFAARGARTKLLRVSHAFHSPLMDPVLGAFEAEIAQVGSDAYTEPRITLVSNLTAERANLALIGHAGYWRRHLREPVRFADAMRRLAAEGITHYIEMSPHPVLLGMGSDVVEGGTWLPSLREGRDDWSVLFESLQTLYVQGAEVDWAGVDAGQSRRHVSAPTYPFQRRRHWIDAAPAGLAVATAPAAQRWAHLVQAMDRQSLRGPIDVDTRRYPHKWALLARITRAVAAQALRDAGLFARAGERYTLSTVMAQAGIAESYRHLMNRWLLGLVREGWLQQQGGAFVAPQPLPEPALPALWQEAEAELADNLPLLNYVRHCAALAGPVLRGRESPLETLFPGGSFELARSLYESSAMMRYINPLAAAAFEASAAMTPPGRQLRVMEIGAGTGGTSSSLLATLPPGRARYRFTDVSEAFLAPARERFASLPGVEFGLFDFEREPAEQGLAADQFDIIVAANAVHAAKDLRAALRRLHSLLAPGGLLVLVESTEHFDYFDITTGLIEGWQHFADDLRGDHPLLKPATWARAFGEAGFEETGTWPRPDSPAEVLGQHVVIGRKAGDTVGTATAAPGTTPSATEAATTTTADAAQPAWRATYDAAAPTERLDLLHDLVRRHVMSTMRLGTDQTPALHDRLMNLGMDSLMAVQLRNGLARAAALPKALPSTLMFDYPTIAAIASYLHERLEGTTPAAPPAAASPAPAAAAAAATFDTAAVAAMSDDDIARLLDQRLGTP